MRFPRLKERKRGGWVQDTSPSLDQTRRAVSVVGRAKGVDGDHEHPMTLSRGSMTSMLKVMTPWSPLSQVPLTSDPRSNYCPGTSKERERGPDQTLTVHVLLNRPLDATASPDPHVDKQMVILILMVVVIEQMGGGRGGSLQNIARLLQATQALLNPSPMHSLLTSSLSFFFPSAHAALLTLLQGSPTIIFPLSPIFTPIGIKNDHVHPGACLIGEETSQHGTTWPGLSARSQILQPSLETPQLPFPSSYRVSLCALLQPQHVLESDKRRH
ncbi:hypothetical protein B0O80DRAFT_192140 [Mortierella sp. GBAus27b]|nr:hypothetical protein B0O80DRAFT_192140 [Mortierella sp. GBAus27b]